MSGAVIEIPADLNPSALDVTITDGGIVFDRRGRRPLRGARVIQAPGEEPKPRRRRPRK